MKKISILIPCYNEQENVVAMSNAVVEEVTKNLSNYDYELVFIDNCSTDSTRPLLREVCKRTIKSRQFLMLGILGSLIPLIMG